MNTTTPRPTSSLDVVTSLLGLRRSGPTERGPQVAAIRSGGVPRFLVPVGSSSAAAASCWAYNRLRDRPTRIRRAVLGSALRVGVGGPLTGERLTIDAGADSLLSHLEVLLGTEIPHVAVGLGPLEAVWKPTLQLLGQRGRPLAYVKVGWTPFTADLVATEAATLARWARHRGDGLVAPTLLARSVWRDTTIVAVAPLPADVRRLADDSRAPSAAAVRHLDGEPTSGPLSDLPWWHELVDSIRAGCGHPSDGGVAARLDAAEADVGGRTVMAARWHGDWTPWNLAHSPTRGLVAWDWEYSAAGVPVGLDEVHAAFQIARLIDHTGAAPAFDRSAHAADPVLAAIHPLVVAERVLRARRRGSPLDASGTETLHVVSGGGLQRRR